MYGENIGVVPSVEKSLKNQMQEGQVTVSW